MGGLRAESAVFTASPAFTVDYRTEIDLVCIKMLSQSVGTSAELVKVAVRKKSKLVVFLKASAGDDLVREF